MTRPADDGSIVEERRASRAGVLLVRVWMDDASAPELEARVIGTLDVSRPGSLVGRANSIDEVAELVTAWLERFLHGDRAGW
jgi:hypothetical protein